MIRISGLLASALILASCSPFEEDENSEAEAVQALTLALALRIAAGNSLPCAREPLNHLTVGATWDSSAPGSVLTTFAGGALFQASTSGPETIMVTTSGTATARIVLHTNPALIGAFADNPSQALSASVNNLCFEVQIMAGALPFQVRVD